MAATYEELTHLIEGYLEETLLDMQSKNINCQKEWTDEDEDEWNEIVDSSEELMRPLIVRLARFFLKVEAIL